MRLLHVFLAMTSFFSASSVVAQDFVWRTEVITATIERDDLNLKIGQYLHLKQVIRPKELAWTMMKIDLPERWSVKDLYVGNGRIRLQNYDGSNYELTRHNVGKLSFEILNGGRKSDAELEELWRRFAPTGANPAHQ